MIDEYYSHWQYAKQFDATSVHLLESAIFKTFSTISSLEGISSDYFKSYFSQPDYYHALEKIILSNKDKKYNFEFISNLFSYLYVERYRINIIHLLMEKSVEQAIIDEISNERLIISDIKLTLNNIFLIKTYLLQVENHLSMLKRDDINEYQSFYEEVQVVLINVLSDFRKNFGNSAACCLLDLKEEYYSYWSFRKQTFADTLSLLDKAIIDSISDPTLEDIANTLVASPMLNIWSPENLTNEPPIAVSLPAQQIESSSTQTP